MDILLNKVTQQALNYAIRSGIAVTGGYAMKQCSRLLQAAPRGGSKDDLRSLQLRLEGKIRIISPAIDMIELIAARGNTSLESAVQLTKDIRWEIQALGTRLATAANEEDLVRRKSARAKSREENELSLQLIVSDMRKLLLRIEDAVPLINLAITTSGVNLTTNLPATVSPSRLLQASTLLTTADTQYRGQKVQVGPVYTLSMYMLFAGHAWRPQDDDDIRATTWKEVIHKARVRLLRVPLDKLYAAPGPDTQSDGRSAVPPSSSIPSDNVTNEFSYQIAFVEDFDDDRVHSFDDDEPQPEEVDGVSMAGIRDAIPIHQISKIFYADTGKILNIGTDGETNSPVLLLKRDISAEPPRRMMDGRPSEPYAYDDSDDANDREVDEQDHVDAQIRWDSTPQTTLPAQEQSIDTTSTQPWRLPPDLDPEWIAFEVYVETADDEEETDTNTSSGTFSPGQSNDTALVNGMAQIKLNTPTSSTSPSPSLAHEQPIRTSLSLLEMLIRLTALQQFRQASHLTIEDELLNFFLEDSSTTGAGPNAAYRQRVRRDARRRLGFDPYDESPMKRRGEEYIAHGRPYEEYGSSPAHREAYEAPAAADDYRSSSPGFSYPSPSLRYPLDRLAHQGAGTIMSSPVTRAMTSLGPVSQGARSLGPRTRSQQNSFGKSTTSAPVTPVQKPRAPPVPGTSGGTESKSKAALLRTMSSDRPRSPLNHTDHISHAGVGDGIGTSTRNA